MGSDRTVAEVVEAVSTAIAKNGLDALDRRARGDYVAFRPYELAATLNRLRTLQVEEQPAIATAPER